MTLSTFILSLHFEVHLRNIITDDLFEKKDNLVNETDTIEYMINKMEKLEYVDKEFKSQIYEREQLSSTAFNSFAIPHSMLMKAKKTGLNIIISNNPISWFNKPVYLILMISINEYERNIFHEIFDPLTIILNEPDNMNKILKCENYEEFINILVSLLH